MTAILLAFVAVLGFGSGAIFARVGMQYASPLPITLVSLVSSFLLSAILAVAFASSDLSEMPPVVLAWCLLLGTLNFLGGRNLNYLAVGRIGAARTSAIVSTSTRPHLLVALGTAVVIGGLITALGRSIFEGNTVGRTALFGFLLASPQPPATEAPTLS